MWFNKVMLYYETNWQLNMGQRIVSQTYDKIIVTKIVSH